MSIGVVRRSVSMPKSSVVPPASLRPVDTGSAGRGNFAGFRKHVIEPSQVRILAYLHVSHAGIFGFSNRVMVGESEELRLMDPISAVEVADANRDLIVGIKVRVGRNSSGTSGIVPLEFPLEVAD
jgi:dihydroorotase